MNNPATAASDQANVRILSPVGSSFKRSFLHLHLSLVTSMRRFHTSISRKASLSVRHSSSVPMLILRYSRVLGPLK